jgi:hypothetical protein
VDKWEGTYRETVGKAGSWLSSCPYLVVDLSRSWIGILETLWGCLKIYF